MDKEIKTLYNKTCAKCKDKVCHDGAECPLLRWIHEWGEPMIENKQNKNI